MLTSAVFLPSSVTHGNSLVANGNDEWVWSLMTANRGGRKAPNMLPLETFSMAGTNRGLSIEGPSSVEDSVLLVDIKQWRPSKN